MMLRIKLGVHVTIAATLPSEPRICILPSSPDGLCALGHDANLYIGSSN